MNSTELCFYVVLGAVVLGTAITAGISEWYERRRYREYLNSHDGPDCRRLE